ncbi:MAG: cupredoxin family copper-binding protein [Candidatus Sericytochromatia bacterium]
MKPVYLWMALLAGGCAGGAPAPQAPATAPAGQTVTIQNYAFAPEPITIAPGGTVTWVNRDGVEHTATPAQAGQFADTGLVAPNGSKAVTFSAPGTYPYYCGVHPSMRGTVVVR